MIDKNKKPDFNVITERDLRDDERMAALYVQAVKAGFWENTSSHSVLRFWALSEKALQDDKKGTPGRLFYALVKAKDFSKLSNQHEDRATQRVPSHERDMIFSECQKLTPNKPNLVSVKTDPEEVSDQLFGRNIGYHHGIMVQCFLPQTRHDDDFWSTTHGKAQLMVEAGRLPGVSDGKETWIKQDVPYGTKARLIMPYIVGYAVQRNSPEVDLGASLRKFLDQIGMSAGGSQGREITRQIHNIAAATIRLGTFHEELPRASAKNVPIAEGYDFWFEGNEHQAGFWQPQMLLGTRFFEALQEHRVPIDMEHMVKLARSARAQDVYVWLAYRLSRLNRPLNIPLSTLQSVFGQSITEPRKFKQKLKSDLRAISKVYDGFNVELPSRKNYMRLAPSKPPVPLISKKKK